MEKKYAWLVFAEDTIDPDIPVIFYATMKQKFTTICIGARIRN